MESARAVIPGLDIIILILQMGKGAPERAVIPEREE